MVESTAQKKLVRVALIGATGSVGKDIVQLAKTNENLDELILVVRKPIEEWSDATQWKCKLTILIKPDFDSFDDVKDSLKDIDAFICCLGTKTKTGEANFVKVDYQYPLNFAEFAKANNVKHYSLLTSGGADAKSSFLYMRVKGQV